MEALFWLQLPNALNHLMNKLVKKSPTRVPVPSSTVELDDESMLSRISSKGKPVPGDVGKVSYLLCIDVNTNFS